MGMRDELPILAAQHAVSPTFIGEKPMRKFLLIAAFAAPFVINGLARAADSDESTTKKTNKTKKSKKKNSDGSTTEKTEKETTEKTEKEAPPPNP
jgi:hypothetical protein